ncbi:MULTISPECIES: DNA-directed RNA polymerase subunit alpha [Peptoniphilus]|jgi:DNA-directed RNA polymerase, alpha subunit|uniref:DNA-directed RNA polymerase subunit alpha n=4 Tax=Peptoniphilaceae TaxID=1570339 RepID=UPI00028977ED|nr:MULTISPECIES: DNA-directed RNA polymerase subunit alpha [Peptoniphilus]MBS6610243.1 DNA-directed RNA polymerase subunit alpha [Peptoniphilus harei]MDU2115516.1 DNA-directed RNA polymerase subunit alpha [Peptoniphilus lacydonensis]MDU5275369.1 DNA-directed RNA polymerase subunit alpha [Peptoniphilus lacydonensis]MDU5377015.1 DNA-directed RNA polymerase subunit alpha [Peptoniphilus lacydonensis]MDU5436667.1 DNA-directed RNA polymerase subunit alpha [Peptoniphilus lacydonensis]
MIEIEKPRISIEELDESGLYGKFVVEPLEAGFGITIGNSLRRVLLSSLPGAAVSFINIRGVEHEFDTIPGVLEDVPEIVLNIKSIVLKMTEDEPVKLTIEKKGKGEIKASDIELAPHVTVINPDQHIATLNDDADFYLEMMVEKGRGYEPSELKKDEITEIGVIPMDSNFTPVEKVNWKVENTRVGQRTDYDRLILEVTTDGSMKADEATSLAAKILTEHLELFIGLKEHVSEINLMVEKEEDQKEKVLEMTVEELDLSVRSFNCLKRAGINSVEELTNKTESEMMKVRNLGRKSLQEVTEKLEELGLSLKSEEE